MPRRLNDVFAFAILGALAITMVVSVQVRAAEEKKPPKITYEEHVKPILRQKCFSCHNTDKKKGDLDLTNFTGVMQGGGSGEVIEPGDSSNSYLYALITHGDEPYMPPESPKIQGEMIETIRKWIDGGALENAGSKAPVIAKKKFDLALSETPTGKPAVPPMPARLSLEPVTRTAKLTAVSALATNPWSPLAAVAGQKQILLYHTQSLELLGALPFPEGKPEVIKFSRNGSLLLVGGGRAGASGRVVVWNIKTGERILEMGDELDTVLAADISADQKLIALGGPQRAVRIYSTETGQLLHELRKHTDWIYSLEFSPDGVLLASGDRNGGLFVWEAYTGREYLTLKAHSKAVTGISWRSDSNVVASGSEDGSIRLWEMENGNQVKNWGGHGGGVTSIEFARDGRIFSCGRDKVAKLWDQNGAQQKAFEAFADLAMRVTFCDETNRAVAGDWNGEIRVWNAPDGARVGNLTSNPPTLAERLDAATKDHAARQAAAPPLAMAAEAALAAANKLKADLAAQQKAAEDAKKKSDAATQLATTTKQAVDQLTGVYQAAAKVVAELGPAVPGLLEAAAKAQETASKIPADKELAEQAAKLKVLADNRAAQLEANRKTVATKGAELDAARKQLASAEKDKAAAVAAMQAAQAEIAKLTPAIKPAEEKAAAAKQAADTAAAAVASAKQQLDRWQGEIAFKQRLDALVAKRKAATEQLTARQGELAQQLAAANEAQAAFEKSKTELAAAGTAMTVAQKKSEAAAVTASGAKQTMTQAVAVRDTAGQAVATLEIVVSSLNETATKAQESAVKSPADKKLAGAAAQLKVVADGKRAELQATQTDAAVKAKAVETAAQQVAAAEKAATEAATVLDAARKRAEQMAAAVKPAEEKATAARQAADAAAKVVDAARKELGGVQQEIAIARGIVQPAAKEAAKQAAAN